MYSKLAWMGIRKNSRLYTPFLLTCIGMVMMYYIISFLAVSEAVYSIFGGATLQTMLTTGVGVLRIFIIIFLFYTNSFLLRRRKREFGLYNILGMGKKNLALVLTFEHAMIAGISIIAGLFFGILFSKLAELGMIYVLQGEATMKFTISLPVVGKTIVFFLLVFALLFLNTLRQVHLSNPLELLRSENAGEKPPKGNWLLAIAGVGILACAYYIAVKITHPVDALVWFFIAVGMVIVGTYLIFISGSVVLCRLLQKNKTYYYKTNHFISVSSMAYRMKRNGAGLASICILCTMVLVMMSSTICLYSGIEENLRNRYPRNITLDISAHNTENLYSDMPDQIQLLTKEITDKEGVAQENILEYRIAYFAGYQTNENLFLSYLPEDFQPGDMELLANIWQIMVVSLDDYNRLMNQNETLNEDEILLHTTKTTYKEDTFCFDHQKTYQIKKQVDFIEHGIDSAQVMPSMFLFVPDISTFVKENELERLLEENESGQILGLDYYYGFDLNLSEEKQRVITEEIKKRLDQMQQEEGNALFKSYYMECVATARSSFYGLYGGLFFLGILLGIVFIFAAVLIIYYKQIAEGYEDQSRFEIMQKVGVTQQEIRKSINSQILTVFFLPLLTAGVHLVFAFPIISKLLLLFGMDNNKLFITVTLICYIVFALCYVCVYKATSRAYYSIVSGK